MAITSSSKGLRRVAKTPTASGSGVDAKKPPPRASRSSPGMKSRDRSGRGLQVLRLVRRLVEARQGEAEGRVVRQVEHLARLALAVRAVEDAARLGRVRGQDALRPRAPRWRSALASPLASKSVT